MLDTLTKCNLSDATNKYVAPIETEAVTHKLI